MPYPFSLMLIVQWDVGMATARHTPAGRGYDSSFGYFFHDNDYWTETNWATFNDSGYSKQCNATFVDLWRFNHTSTGPAGVCSFVINLFIYAVICLFVRY